MKPTSTSSRSQPSRRQFISSIAAAVPAVLATPLVGLGAERDWSGRNPVRYPDPDTIEVRIVVDRWNATAP